MHSKFSFSIRPLMMAIHMATLTAIITPVTVHASTQINIQAGDLEQALNQYAIQHDVNLVIDGDHLRGMKTSGLHGTYTLENGFNQLLIDTPYQIARIESGYILIPKQKQTNDTVRNMGQLKQINVLSDQKNISGTNAGTLPAIIVDATQNQFNLGKVEQSIKDIPQSVTLMNRKQLDDQNLTDLSTALDKVPGISLWQGSVFENTFVARGMEVSNIRVDGVASALRLQDLSQFEQIEVLRGADGLFNGNGEPSASVNLVRKKPLHEPQIALELSTASWDNHRASIDVTGPIALDGNLRGRVVATWNDQDFFYAVADKNRKMLYGILEYDILPTTTASIGFSYDKLKGKQDWIGLPRYADGSDIGFDRKTSFVTNWSNIEAESTQYFANIEHQINDNWTLKFNTTKENMLKLNEYARLGGAIDPNTNIAQMAFIKNGSEPDSWVADLNLQGKFNLFNREHSAVIGIDYQDKEDPFYYMTDSLEYYNFNLFEFTPNMAYKPVHSYRPTRTVYTKQLGYYTTVKWQLADTLKLITGARLNNYDFYQRNDQNNTTTYDYQDKNVFVPFVGLTFDITPAWLIYGSVAETFKSQANYQDINHQPLDPVTGRTYEIGLKGDLWDSRGQFSLSTYRTERNGQAELLSGTTSVNDGVGNLCCYIAAGDVTMSGIDLEVMGEVLPNLTGSVGYTYFDNKNNYNPISWRQITTPRHTLKAWLDYQIEDWSVGVNVVAQSEQYATGETPTVYDQNSGTWGGPRVKYKFISPGRAVWGTQIGYQINSNIHAAFRVNNLFDKVYWQTVGDTQGYNWYGEPRNFMFTLRAKY